MRLLCLVLSFSFFAVAEDQGFVHFTERNKVYVSSNFSYQTASVETSASGTSSASSSDFTMMGANLNLDYFFTSKIAVSFNYFFALALDIDTEVQGFDLGAKYYFVNGASKEIEFKGNSLVTSPDLSYYGLINAATKNFQLGNSNLQFQGIELGAGADWHYDQNFFLRGEASSEILLNTNVRTYQSFGGSLGVGYKF